MVKMMCQDGAETWGGRYKGVFDEKLHWPFEFFLGHDEAVEANDHREPVVNLGEGNATPAGRFAEVD